MNDLPRGWVEAAGDDLFSSVRGVTYSKSDSSPAPGNGLVPILRANNIVRGSIVADDLVFVPANCVSPEQNLQDGDLLIASSSGSRTVVGKAAPASGNDHIYAFGAFCTVARPRTSYLGKWLSAYSRSRAYRDYVEEVALGININNLRGSDLKAIPIPVAPLSEQQRIVAKIDSLTGKSRRARDHLDHIPRLVEKYKQAVLNLAFSHLAVRIRLLDMVASERGIPYGIVQTGTPYEGGIPTVRCGDIKDFRVELDQLKRVDPGIEQGYQRTRLKGGEVLIAIRGSVGETCVVPAHLTGCNISREVAMIPPKSDVSSEFIMYFLATSEAKRFILGNTKGVAQQGINLRDLNELPTPNCSLNEQIAVVERIQAAFVWIERLAADLNSAHRLIDHLDQSVLAKAFKGELVPQDPTDEPASALLERIRAERAAAPKAKRGRKKAA